MPRPVTADRKAKRGQTDSAVAPATDDGRAKRIGIREIARLADVSVATVSMVLNNNPKITEATSKKVRRVMDQQGYRPNRIAQSLSSKYTRMLAVMLPTLRHALADPYFGELISGICDRAARLGHKVIIEHAKPDFVKEKRHLELFERRFVDGVLCLGFNDRHSFLQDLAQHEFPMVVVNTVFPQWELNHVVCDYASGADQAMTYLLQLGHKKIAMVHGSPDVATARLVKETFRRRVDEAGLDIPDSMMIDGRFTEQHGYEAAQALFDRHPDVTAVFAGNDKMALGVMHHLSQRGRRVPQDVSVMGFDDIQYAAFVNPALSTVHLPLYEVGTSACEQLIERIRGKRDRIQQVHNSHLVLRESTSLAASR
ncbi:MAG: substrate-binding domain-containing protein [Planctomycetes bacterium]|jgi:DNA-binding LacI/PurR family transcriptional regulator|nr:substrate-binding domain-containing protein [Planctomycetota bacterium]